MSRFCVVSLSFLVLAAPSGRAQGQLTLADGGRSAFVIYLDAAAPQSVQLAAQELQRVLKASTGAELPVQTSPATPMVCLGDNAASRQCGLNSEGMAQDAFRVVTRNGNLYILGNDTQTARRGGISRGTLFGTCDFLERRVGVRWLLPGEVGEEIPRHDRLIVAALDLRDQPDFPFRYLDDIQDRRPGQGKIPNTPREWVFRQKLLWSGEGRRMDHGHAWDEYLKPAEWEAHPEWMAADDSGKRRSFVARPAGVKYCTTNPQLVQAFANGVIAWLDTHPTWPTASISPADGGDFCECPECRKLVTQDPYDRPSYTNNILKFYNDVARIVGQKHPDRPLAGYVYYNYMYPPAEPTRMEPNVRLVMAPLNYYGYGLYKPVYRAEFARVIEGWLKVTPNFVYHNYSNWMRSFNGAPLPVARDILKLELPTIKKSGGQGAEMLGVGAWGYGGPTNYVYAKQLWHADADVEKLFDEWLRLAYGPGWRAMRRVYELTEAGMKARKEAESPRYKGEMYEVNYDVIEKVYLPIFPEMERLYQEALAKAATDKQRARIAMFGDNLVQLHYNMRQAGMAVPDPVKSLFYRTEDQYRQFLADTETTLSLYADHGKRFTGPIWKGEWSG